MANTRFLGACAVLLVLLLCHEFSCVKGRHLRSAMCKKCSRHRQTSLRATEAGEAPSGLPQMRTSKMEHIEDFRPTSPGHSPGVGHSIHNWTSQIQVLVIIFVAWPHHETWHSHCSRQCCMICFPSLMYINVCLWSWILLSAASLFLQFTCPSPYLNTNKTRKSNKIKLNRPSFLSALPIFESIIKDKCSLNVCISVSSKCTQRIEKKNEVMFHWIEGFAWGWGGGNWRYVYMHSLVGDSGNPIYPKKWTNGKKFELVLKCYNVQNQIFQIIVYHGLILTQSTCLCRVPSHNWIFSVCPHSYRGGECLCTFRRHAYSLHMQSYGRAFFFLLAI